MGKTLRPCAGSDRSGVAVGLIGASNSRKSVKRFSARNCVKTGLELVLNPDIATNRALSGTSSWRWGFHEHPICFVPDCIGVCDGRDNSGFCCPAMPCQCKIIPDRSGRLPDASRSEPPRPLRHGAQQHLVDKGSGRLSGKHAGATSAQHADFDTGAEPRADGADRKLIFHFIDIGDQNRLEELALPLIVLPDISPVKNGEKDAVVGGFANFRRCKNSGKVEPAPFSPSLYGEKVPAGG